MLGCGWVVVEVIFGFRMGAGVFCGNGGWGGWAWCVV